MKKRVFLIWSILAIAVIPLLVGCGDDEKQEENQDFPYYADIGEEELTSMNTTGSTYSSATRNMRTSTSPTPTPILS